MTQPVPVRRALLSVSDKSGLIDFAQGLASIGVELVSTGGTAAALRAAGLTVLAVDQLTDYPEMMDGRVKTLHPAVHGGILALRDHPEHLAAMQRHGIAPIDLVCINLYPFESTIAREGVSRSEAIENIDVGGPAMIRAAAKNHRWVAVVTSPDQYQALLASMRDHAGATTLALREELAARAFARTSAYDAAITNYLSSGPGDVPHVDQSAATTPRFPDLWSPSLRKVQDLRYGENPHQAAALYSSKDAWGPSVVGAMQLHGKELSYNNLNDAAAALAAALDLAAAPRHASMLGACVIKHANPCGGSASLDAKHAVELAMKGDPLAAYGGVLALSGVFDRAAADIVCAPGAFLEVIIAQRFDPSALDMLRAKSANVRLLAFGDSPVTPISARPLMYKSIPGGALVQQPDLAVPDPSTWTLCAGPTPTREQMHAAAVVAVLAKHLSSNAIAIGGADPASPHAGVRLFGAGAGQMDRVTSCRLAVEKAGELARGAIAVGDAFFPFPDGPRVLIDAGVRMIVHPGGSKRDQETFDLCAQRGVTCMTTGLRHFRH